jgi:hypothetical protein
MLNSFIHIPLRMHTHANAVFILCQQLRTQMFPNPSVAALAQSSMSVQPQRVFTSPTTGQKQDFVENVRFVRGPAMFVVLHMPGSNNNKVCTSVLTSQLLLLLVAVLLLLQVVNSHMCMIAAWLRKYGALLLCTCKLRKTIAATKHCYYGIDVLAAAAHALYAVLGCCCCCYRSTAMPSAKTSQNGLQSSALLPTQSMLSAMRLILPS